MAYQRHCERSEAIHFTAAPRRKMDCFVASAFARRRASADKSAPRNDAVTFRFKFQTADVRSHSRGTTCPSHTVTLSLKQEGAGNAGCALHPRSRVQSCAKSAHTSIQGSGGDPTFPAQWHYDLYRALPGVSGFLASVASRKLARRPGRAFRTSARLDANL